MWLAERLGFAGKGKVEPELNRTGLEELADYILTLEPNRQIIVFTGAGISTASGIPDYRSENGLFSLLPDKALSIGFFNEGPEQAWRKVYLPVYQCAQHAKPNEAHLAIAELEQMEYVRSVVTQNVDDLHERAGSTTVKYHGDGRYLLCRPCKRSYEAPDFSNPETVVPPCCPQCKQILKPAVTLYGEYVPTKIINEVNGLIEQADLCLVIGTSLNAFPANEIYNHIFGSGNLVAWFNRESPDEPDPPEKKGAIFSVALPQRITPPDFTILGNVEQTLPQLVQMLKKRCQKTSA